MVFNFSEICADHLEKHGKSLNSLKKKFIKEIGKAITLLNNDKALNCRGEIKTVIDDLFNDETNKSISFMAKMLNVVQAKLPLYFE